MAGMRSPPGSRHGNSSQKWKCHTATAKLLQMVKRPAPYLGDSLRENLSAKPLRLSTELFTDLVTKDSLRIEWGVKRTPASEGQRTCRSEKGRHQPQGTQGSFRHQLWW